MDFLSTPLPQDCGSEETVQQRYIAWNKGKTDVYSAETLKRMRDAARNRSPEHYCKISTTQKGRPLSDQHRKKISVGIRNSDAHKNAIKNRDMSNVSSRMSEWHKTPEKQKQHREHNLKQKNPLMTPKGYFIGTTEAQKAYGYKSKNSIINKCRSNDPKYANWYYIE